ncbi:DUF805 domain-containing protein [Aeromicrobium fastidiosum]|uniref:DUF805 domain-containing protein n=1 Tax=Aeromicrobium fastidiosum TaxID=52699 RepID=UPI0020236D35|nr:DUF805 domain-containing protein [Aeromicrobium fastidiosum]MCL8250611.1 DUF805 domain-containing protein [Aeromicrobium fastidiosum]
MTMLEAVRSVLTQYATFSGRARRSEYWFWTLAAFVVQVAGSLVDQLLDLSFVEWVVIALTFVPSIAVGSRRLHDTGRSGWLQLLWIIPIVGWIFVIVWSAEDSHPVNEHGPNPKDVQAPGLQTPPAY